MVAWRALLLGWPEEAESVSMKKNGGGKRPAIETAEMWTRSKISMPERFRQETDVGSKRAQKSDAPLRAAGKTPGGQNQPGARPITQVYRPHRTTITPRTSPPLSPSTRLAVCQAQSERTACHRMISSALLLHRGSTHGAAWSAGLPRLRCPPSPLRFCHSSLSQLVTVGPSAVASPVVSLS